MRSDVMEVILLNATMGIYIAYEVASKMSCRCLFVAKISV